MLWILFCMTHLIRGSLYCDACFFFCFLFVNYGYKIHFVALLFFIDVVN